MPPLSPPPPELPLDSQLTLLYSRVYLSRDEEVTYPAGEQPIKRAGALLRPVRPGLFLCKPPPSQPHARPSFLLAS